MGYASKGYEMISEILEACLELIRECRCSLGCPSCVGSPLPPYAATDPDSDVKGSIPDKEAAILILHDLLGKEPYVPKVGPPLQEAMLEIAAEAEVKRPPSTPLPERVELRIRQQVQRLNSRRQ
jgi:DEAD/DEAH box helicase domain-containing protein